MKKTIASTVFCLAALTGSQARAHDAQEDVPPGRISKVVVRIPRKGCRTVRAQQISRDALGIPLSVPDTRDGSPMYVAVVAPSERVRTRTNVTMELRSTEGNLLAEGRSFCRDNGTRDVDCEPMVGASFPARAQNLLLVVHGREKNAVAANLEVCGSDGEAPPQLAASMAIWPEDTDSVFPDVETALAASR